MSAPEITDAATESGKLSRSGLAAWTRLMAHGKFSDDPAGLTAAVAERGGVSQDEAAEIVAEGLREREPAFTPKPLDLDFDTIPDPPDWIVDRWIERGTVVPFSGDTGSAKSIVSTSLWVRALTTGEWLDHATSIERVIVVDEENPARLVRARMRALGLTNEHRDRLRYFSREGVALADGGSWDGWMRSELDEFRPDLLVIDTLMSATDVEDTNSNSEAVKIMKRLRAMAAEYGCAILLMHHERKRSLMNPASSGQAMMGARQWAGQADGQWTITVASDLTEEAGEGEPDRRNLRRTFSFLPAEKDRDGTFNAPHLLAVESEKDAAGRLLAMAVVDEGVIAEDTAQDAAEGAILAALRVAEGEGVLSTSDLAKAIGKPADDGSFKRGLKRLTDADRIEQPGRGRYRITEEGRAAAGLPV